MATNKTLHVTCAIIEKKGHVLVAQRSATMSLPLKWEFPGGKLHGDETPEECITRELQEELEIDVQIVRKMDPSKHQYPEFEIVLYPFVCVLKGSFIKVNEHECIKWIPTSQLSQVDWADADIPIMKSYVEHLK